MKTLILSNLFLICALVSFGQEKLDKKIVVVVSDTSNLYQRVRIAFGKNDFQVKEDGDYSTVSTFARPLRSMAGYAISIAEISGNRITISGRYGQVKINDWGKTREDDSWKNIVYMKGSKLWPLLEKVADKLDGEISYSK